MKVPESSKKAAVSVSEVASMCGLSRSRFHVLVKAGVFPKPVQPGKGKRPYYNHELIQRCLEIRSTGIGQNGEVVLFNRPQQKKTAKKPTVASASEPAEHRDLLDALVSLGLSATSQGVGAAVQAIYPQGTAGIDHGEVIRKVFLQLQRARR